ncbi:GIY-YIG nuclease family protein [Ferdinandcohnia quinoae]|uniref:GIY-YIG nuclease family protein n=1 Tax=Fredinandcohnia quinoae TaxID=2918902 RepID=A0AAW5E3L0_9BACI|nr:GIY-YIG nuclease family protein [Fredinandcohnia sp. SECRCQ15]MCH1626953.1 GIY-YIG nuclease family protein [Fredinandcohnia sp. SECRCQ15]
MEKSKHYFYVVECKDGTYYAGYTNDLDQRIKKHNEGKGAKYTRGRTPVILLMFKEFESKGDALRAEYKFKQLKRPQKEQFIIMERGTKNVATEELSTKL